MKIIVKGKRELNMKTFILFLGFSGLVLLLGIGFIFEKVAIHRELNSLEVKGQLLNIGGGVMHIQCVGRGSPIVILEAGLGSDMTSWDRIIEPVSKFTKVCRYDRRGYGLSESNPSDATIHNQIFDLKMLLEAAGANEPKILVGHSAGGMYARHFSKSMPSVVGLVLVDSSVELSKEEFDHFFKVPILVQIQGLVRRVAAKFSLIRIRQAIFEEKNNINARPRWQPAQNTASSRYLNALFYDEAIYVHLLRSEAPHLGDLPLVVISRGKDFMNNGSKKSEFDLAWSKWQKRLLDLSSQSSQIIARQSGHIIQDDEPEIIVNAIKAIWKNRQHN